MCIDLFAPGSCLDVVYLHEQIWFELDGPLPKNLKITEVYDILIRNPKFNSGLEEIWALFPHDCTHLRDVWQFDPQTYEEVEEKWQKQKTQGTISDSIIGIQPIQVNPEMPEVFDKYNWPYTEKPKKDKQENHVIWEPAEAPTIIGFRNDRDDSHFEGVSLNVEIGFPEELKSNLSFLKILSEKKVGKTLARLKLTPPIQPGGKGWLRLVVKPTSVPYFKPEKKIVPCMPYPLAFEQKCEATCPLIVRAGLELYLKKYFKECDKDKDLIWENYEKLQGFMINEGYYKHGTSTRISDQRIALISGNENIEILEAQATTGMDFFGIFRLCDDPLRTAFLWGGGSGRNTTDDLVYTVYRVINKLRAPESKLAERTELVRDLAPSGLADAFQFLISQMIDVKLLSELPTLLEIYKDILDEDMENRLCRLRAFYSAPPRNEAERWFLSKFHELHPFQIYFRVRWNNLSEDIKDRWEDYYHG